MKSLSKFLQNCLQGKVVVVGIGNRLRGDDGAGSLLAARLSGKINGPIFDSGEVPESYTDKIKEQAPDTILLIDAINTSRESGAVVMLKPEDLKNKPSTSTHNISLAVLSDYLKKETGAEIFLLGIQPKTTGFGEGMSEEVEQSLEVLEDMFISCLNTQAIKSHSAWRLVGS